MTSGPAGRDQAAHEDRAGVELGPGHVLVGPVGAGDGAGADHHGRHAAEPLEQRHHARDQPVADQEPVTVRRRARRPLADDEPLLRDAFEQGAVAAVVGLPRNMDGTEGSRAERCREFALMLADEAGIPVAMTDERLTTVAASRYLNETDTRGKKRKGVIDTLSAEIILQNTLDRLRNL